MIDPATGAIIGTASGGLTLLKRASQNLSGPQSRAQKISPGIGGTHRRSARNGLEAYWRVHC